MNWKGLELALRLPTSIKRKRKTKCRRPTTRDTGHRWLSHIMLLWRKGVHLQDRQYIKHTSKLKKRTKCSIDKYIIVSSFLLRPSSHGTEPNMGSVGGSLEERSSIWILCHYYSYTIYSSTVTVLCQTWQRGRQIRWHDMANRSLIYTLFLFFASKDPRQSDSTLRYRKK